MCSCKTSNQLNTRGPTVPLSIATHSHYELFDDGHNVLYEMLVMNNVIFLRYNIASKRVRCASQRDTPYSYLEVAEVADDVERALGSRQSDVHAPFVVQKANRVRSDGGNDDHLFLAALEAVHRVNR